MQKLIFPLPAQSIQTDRFQIEWVDPSDCKCQLINWLIQSPAGPLIPRAKKKMDWSKQQWWQDADFKKPMKGRHVCLAPGVDQQEWGEYGRILSKAWLVQNDNIHYLNDQKLRFSGLEFWSIRILACLDCPSKMMTWGTLSSQSDSFLTKQVLTRKREAGPRVINHPAEVCQNKIIPYYPAKNKTVLLILNATLCRIHPFLVRI